MANSQDHYQILDLETKKLGKPISAADLKQAYRQALLKHHPDKSGAHQAITASVDEITEAYRILADPILREEYDQRLGTQVQDGGVQTRHTGIETVDLEELDFNEERGVWGRTCRCGNLPAFVISEEELEKNVEYGELVTGCKGCSLWLRVLFGVAD